MDIGWRRPPVLLYKARVCTLYTLGFRWHSKAEILSLLVQLINQTFYIIITNKISLFLSLLILFISRFMSLF